jgi:hypothetical protein
MSVVAPSRADRSNYRIVRALNEDWGRLTLEHHDSVCRWASKHPVLDQCASLLDLLETVRRNPDPVLFALLEENATGDELAGRAVLQAMLGKLVRMAACDVEAQVGDYVAAMWCRIRTYPVRDRPVNVAANLALDCLKEVKKESRWLRRGMEVAPMAPGPLLDQLYTEAFNRVHHDHNVEVAASTATSIITTADRLGLIDVRTREVLLSVYADGLTGRDAADRHETSPAMIRFRCSKAVRRLAQHSSSLAEAA